MLSAYTHMYRKRSGNRKEREICPFNGHFYDVGELGGCQTALLLTTVFQTPDRCISVCHRESDRCVLLQSLAPHWVRLK